MTANTGPTTTPAAGRHRFAHHHLHDVAATGAERPDADLVPPPGDHMRHHAVKPMVAMTAASPPKTPTASPGRSRSAVTHQILKRLELDHDGPVDLHHRRRPPA
jgi:hypothetical protein